MRCCSALLIGWFAATAAAQVPPEKAIATFTASPGLEVSLWASEPLCVNPTCCDVDHKGRVWMPESINYRNRLRNQPLRRPEGDRIIVLEDSQGTGKADKATVFYQSPDILAPLGIAVLPYPDGKGVKVFVCQSPDILVFEDRDGDLKADGPPTRLLTGFRGLDHDHGVHGILIGPDNKLYFTVGDQGVSNLKSSDGKGRVYNSNSTDVRAATMWRCDLDGKNLELIAHNFRNNYEPCVDSFGTVYLSDNDDDGNQQTRICYVMKGGDYGYHRTPKTSHWNEEHPGIVPKILRTYFGSPTGICMYEGSLLGPSYQGQLLHTDAGPRHVRCYHLKHAGAAYAVDREDMLQSTDNWFRPSDVCVAPDGSLIVADWYDPGVGGHGVGDFTRGRMYRIAPSGSKGAAPKFDVQSPEGIAAALASPNLATRAAGMHQLGTLGKAEATAVLQRLSGKDAPRWLRARAIWQAARLGDFGPAERALDDGDPDFRILALRVLKDFRGQSPVDLSLDRQGQIVHDSSAAVRREALLLLQDVEPAKSANLIHTLAATYDGKDRFFLAAVGIAVGQHDARRREALLAEFDKRYPDWNDSIAGLLWELHPPQATAMLTRRLTSGGTPPLQRLQVIDILAASNDGQAGTTLAATLATEKDAAVRERLLLRLRENLPSRWKSLAGSKELTDAVRAHVKSDPTAVLDLIAAGELKDFAPEVIAQALDSKAAVALRLQAVRTLGSLKTAAAQKELAALGSDPKDAILAAEAVQALGRQGTPAALKSLRSIIADPAQPQALRQAAAVGLAGHRESSNWLLEDFASKKLAADLGHDLSRLLRNSPYPDIKKRAEGALPQPPRLDPKNLPSIAALLTRKGNAPRGKELIQASLKNDAACLKCHTIDGTGGKVGPDLSVIGSKASRENLLESILYPSRAIDHQFETWIIETSDGKTITGVLAEETPAYLLLRDANTNEHKLDKSKVESRAKSPLSLMPADVVLHLPENDLIDVVEYLYSLKSPVLTPTGLSRDDTIPLPKTRRK